MQDYSERRTVSSNRPRKQGMARYFVLTAVAGLLVGGGLGFTGGWIATKPARQEMNSLRAQIERLTAATRAAAAPAPQPAAPKQPSGESNDYSFYKGLTAPKGAIGTGLNPDKPDNPAPRPSTAPSASAAAAPEPAPSAPTIPKPAPKAPPAAPPPAQERKPPEKSAPKPVKSPAPAATPSEQKEAAPPVKAAAKPSPPATTPAPAPPASPQQAQKAQPKGKYVVQIASCQSRAEAEAMKGRLQDAGVAAYITEWTSKDKGTMYRVRVGKNMDQADATELAGKVGRNAIPILDVP